MGRFEENVFGLVKKEDLLQVGWDVTRPNDPVDQVIGDVRTDNLIAYWESIAAEYNIPVMAQFHAFDVEAQKTLRIPIDVNNIEKGLIKVKIDQSERLRTLMGRGVTNEDALYNRVLDDAGNLAEQVFTRSKVAKNELLATGKVTIKENNLDLTVDYNVPNDHLNIQIDFGAGADMPIDEQLQKLIDEADMPINGLYTSKANLTKLRKNLAIRGAVNGIVGNMLSMAQLEDYLGTEFGINRIYVNDLYYSLPLTMGADGRPVVNKKRYYPADRMTFFSADGNVADGLWGDPPEVSAQRFLDVEQSQDYPYVYITQYAEHDPAVTWTKADALFIPALYSPDSLYVATAIETPGA